jgi:peptidoglycan/LPS O-acetylase OafA/YrhL
VRAGVQGKPRPPEIGALTTIRFFAAVHVVFHHFAARALAGAPEAVRALAANGYIGVSFFFVLSGFILTYNYGLRSLDARKFFVARFARIYPLYAVAGLLAVPLAVEYRLAKDCLGMAVAKFGCFATAYVTLTEAWIPSLASALNPPAWSISAEAFFYASFVVLLPRLADVSSPRLAVAVAVAWVVSMIVPGAYVAAYWRAPEELATGSFLFQCVKFLPPVHLPEFFIGACFGLLFLRRSGRDRAPVPTPVVITLALAPAALMSVRPGRFFLLFHDGLLAPLFGAFLYSLAAERGGLGRVLSARRLVFLGQSSYAVYILQAPLWALLAPRVRSVVPSESLVFCACIAALILVSGLSYKFIEEPARTWLVARYAARGAGVLAPSAGGAR